MLRQDPLECAFEFICSSNNHISRIHGMVETLCREFGTRLHAAPALAGREVPQSNDSIHDKVLKHAVPQLYLHAVPALAGRNRPQVLDEESVCTGSRA